MRAFLRAFKEWGAHRPSFRGEVRSTIAGDRARDSNSGIRPHSIARFQRNNFEKQFAFRVNDLTVVPEHRALRASDARRKRLLTADVSAQRLRVFRLTAAALRRGSVTAVHSNPFRFLRPAQSTRGAKSRSLTVVVAALESARVVLFLPNFSLSVHGASQWSR